jgi:hypothetical protein
VAKKATPAKRSGRKSTPSQAASAETTSQAASAETTPPARSTTSEQVQPGEPAQPIPTAAEPAPADSIAAQPTPAEATAAEPTAAEPTPADRTAAESTARPAPADSLATQPTPAEPTAAEPTPADRTAAESTARPTPADSPGTQPTPAEPTADPPTPAEAMAAEATAAESLGTQPTQAEPTAPQPTTTEATPAEPAAAEQLTPQPSTSVDAGGVGEQEPAPVSAAAGGELTPTPAELVNAAVEVTPAQSRQVASTPYTEAWAKLIADPGHAPELLALAAVQTLGPRALDWVTRTRDAYPQADETALARLATRQFTRFGSLGSVFGAIAGSYAPIALLGSVAVTQAELVLHLAAAYGLDPTDAERAVDLLVLTRVHATRADAEAALDAARQPAYEDGGASSSVWRLGRAIVAQTGAWAVIRLVNRYLPGVSLLAAVVTSQAAVDSAAVRANKYFRDRQPS